MHHDETDWRTLSKMTPLVLPLLPQSMAKNGPPVLVYQKKFLDSHFAIRPLLLAKSLGR